MSDAALATTDDADRATLAARARDLARPLAEVGHTDAALELLAVDIAGERIALPLEAIVHVHRATEVTPVPGAPARVVGLVAWRGRVLTVVDLAERGGNVEIGEQSRVLVLGERRAAFGLLVDAVDDVVSVDAADVGPIDDAAPERAALFRGVTGDATLVADGGAIIERFTRSH